MAECRTGIVHHGEPAGHQHAGGCDPRLAGSAGGAMSVGEKLLEVSNLRIMAVGRGAEERPPLLEGFSFDIAPGEFVALVGESGSGKTMAARSIPDLLPPGVARVAARLRPRWLHLD